MSIEETVKQGIEQALHEIKSSIPDHIDFDKFVARAVVCIVNGKNLLNCNPYEINSVCCRAAMDGVYLDGREAAIVSYNRKNPATKQFEAFPQYLCMVDGALKRVRMSGEIKIITAKPIYQNDTFDYWIDEHGEHITYRPAQSNSGALVGAFAYARIHTNELVVEYMTMDDINKVKGASKTSTYGPWKDWFDRMAVKSVLHRLMRKLPNSSDILKMLESGMNMEFDKDEDVQNDVQNIVQFYCEDKFLANFETWSNLINTGKQTADNLIKIVESKSLPMTEDQKTKIRGLTNE